MDHTRDVVFMAEVHDETTYVRRHKQKLVLVLSAMRHFAASLRAEGMRMDYVQLDDKGNSGSFTGELGRALSRHHVDRIVVAQPGEWRVWEMDPVFGARYSTRRLNFVKMFVFFARELNSQTGRREARAFGWSTSTVTCGARPAGS